MVPEHTTDPWRRTAWVAAGAQAVAALLIVVVGGISSTWRVDPLRPVALGVLLLVPSIVAVVATVRAHPPLLLVAAVTSATLALVPLSAHSLVFLGAGVAHVVAASRGWRPGDRLRLLPAIACPLLAVAALGVQVGHADAACYARLTTGEVLVDRSVGDVSSGFEVEPAGSQVAERGCTGDTVVAWEAAASVALSAAAVAVTLPRGNSRTPQHSSAAST